MRATQPPKRAGFDKRGEAPCDPHGADSELKIHLWRLTRREVRELKKHLSETGALHSAEMLLRHSIAFGHGRLLVRRYLLVCALGLARTELYEPYFLKASIHLPPGELARTHREIARLASRLQRISVDGVEAARHGGAD
jgi:hypothetical protein